MTAGAAAAASHRRPAQDAAADDPHRWGRKDREGAGDGAGDGRDLTPRLPEGMTVVGGAGGTIADLTDLDAAAAALEVAAGALQEAARWVATTRRLVDEGASWSPVTAAWARAAIDPLAAPRDGVGRQADRALESAAGLRRTAALYAGTDLDVCALVRAGGIAAGHVVGEMGPRGLAVAGAAAAAAGVQAVGGTIGLRALKGTPTSMGLALRVVDLPGATELWGPLGFTARLLAGPGPLPGSLGLPSASTVQPLVPGLAALARGLLPGRVPIATDPVPSAARLLADASVLAGAALGAPSRLSVTHRTVPAAQAPPAPRTTADVLRQIEALYPHRPEPAEGTTEPVGPAHESSTKDRSGTKDRRHPTDRGGAPVAGTGAAGTVSIQRLDHRDGRRSWVVAVPGTQDRSPLPGANPMDMATNLQIVAGRMDDATRLVTEAMLRAGIEPGEPVLLAGHSQGGLVVMGIAQDEALRESFSITAVVTAGAPVGSAVLPVGVQSLHLEHLQDLVPAVEGRANPDHPQRSTVLRDLGLAPTSTARDAAGSVGAAHEISTYVATAAELEGVGHPSLDRFDRALRTVLGDAPPAASTQWFTGVRQATTEAGG